MSIFESMKTNAQNLRTEINEILKMNREDLYGEDRLHELSFNHYGKEQFEHIFSLIEDLSKCHFDKVPEEYISPILDRLFIYKGIFEKAKSLNLKEDSPKNTRDKIVQEAEKNYDGFWTEVSKVISFANQAGTDLRKIEREARQTLEKVKTDIDVQKKQINDKEKEIDSILKSIRAASAEAGVSQKAIHFSEAQKNHAKNANKWRNWVTGLLIGLIIAVLATGIAFFEFSKSNTPLVLGYLEFATLIIISLWIYAINFCNRNFHAEKHNEISNANKAKTLATFRSFIDATENRYIKDRVLIQASASAFSNSSTGFGKNQIGPLPLPMEMGKQIVKHSDESP